LLAVVGQLTPWKGQDDAIEILARIRGRFPDAVLALAGERKFDAATRHDNKAFELRLHDLCARRGVAGSVRFLGEREDVADLLPAVDVLLVPSWEEPFGRTVLEGMAAGVVVVATDTGGPAEIAHDGSDAVLLPPRQPAAWAEELVSLLSSDEARLALAEGGRRRAEAFARERGERMRTIVDAYRIATMTPPGRRLRGLVHV
jgi:glycosyltransferase involved in cell wall biosynthesis